MKLYVAYGSNLNKQQMRHRCPSAKPVYTGYLNNWELIYRGSKTGSYATIRRKKGYRVPVVVWGIQHSDERNLDIYEGYPRFYSKQNVYVTISDDSHIKAINNTRYIIPAHTNTLSQFRHVYIIINYGLFNFFAPCRKSSFHIFHPLIVFKHLLITFVVYIRSILS